MTEQDYKDLNYYLNICCNYLRGRDYFFLDNIPRIAYLSQMFINCTNKYELKKIEEEESLTFDDVFLLAREIIESINPKYLESFDKILANGELDFSYDNFYWGSHTSYKKDIKEINMNRSFNYDDVIVLVHEYIHYQNVKEYKSSIFHYLISEFLSIYYEIYAGEFLVKQKGIAISKIDFDKRLIYEKRNAGYLAECSLPLFSFEKFGTIDENSHNMLKIYNFATIEKEDFDNICLEMLKRFKNIEKKYINEIRYEKEFNELELEEKLISPFSQMYRYILGTLLAYYAIENCDINKITYLNDHINDEKYKGMATLADVLKTIDINLNDPNINEKLLKSLENGLNKGDLCKK